MHPSSPAHNTWVAIGPLDSHARLTSSGPLDSNARPRMERVAIVNKIHDVDVA